MTVEQVSVIDVGSTYVRINARQQQHCKRCAMQSGCGHQLFAELANRKQPDTSLQLPIDQDLSRSVQAGDTLDLMINDAKLVNLALLHYGLPIILMLLGTVAAQGIAGNIAATPDAGEAWVIATALGMLAIGMGVVHKVASKLSPGTLMAIQLANADIHSLNNSQPGSLNTRKTRRC